MSQEITEDIPQAIIPQDDIQLKLEMWGLDKMPQEMQDTPNWFAWAFHYERGTKVKDLYQIDGKKVDPEDPKTWGTLENALNQYSSMIFCSPANDNGGVGFIFTEDSQIINVDYYDRNSKNWESDKQEPDKQEPDKQEPDKQEHRESKNTTVTYIEDLLTKFNKIPYYPQTDLCKNLNEELANVLIMHPELKKILKKDSDRWDIQDFIKIGEILGKYGFAYWDACKVFESYALGSWESLHEGIKLDIENHYFDNAIIVDEDPFKIDFDIFPFEVSKGGIIKHYIDKKDKENEIIITNTPIIIHKVGECLDDDSYKYMIKYQTITGEVYTRWENPDLLLTSKIKELVNLGLQFTDKQSSDLKQFFNIFLGNAHSIPREYTANKNGWKKDETILITGSYAHTPYGKKEILALTEEIAQAYEVRGNKKNWIENIKPLLDFDLLRLKCYATVAAIIIRFLGVKSFVLHNYYESSGLKTVTMQIAASLMGNPLELIRDADSTKVGIEKSLEYNTDTPIYFDETSNNPEFQNVIYMIGNEKGKNRGNQDLGLAKVGTWKTVVQTTGETPLSKGQSINTGIQMRVVEIFQGIPRLDADYIERVKETIDNNYGLFQDEIIQRIFKDKDNLKLFYKNIYMRFGKAQSVFADRTKNYFIALAVAGMILEDVFKENGIPEKDPIEICKDFYQKTVIEDPTIPYHIRALDTVYSWHLRNKKFFEYSKDLDTDGKYTIRGAVELKGWITANAIYYDPDKLREYLTDKGFNFDRVIEDWKKNEVLDSRKTKDKKTGVYKYQSWKNNTVINDQRIVGVKIPFEKLKTILDIRDEEIIKIKKGNEESNINKISTSLIESCDTFLYENPELKNVVYTPEEVAGLFISSKDREQFLIYGKTDIIKAFEFCKRHK